MWNSVQIKESPLFFDGRLRTCVLMISLSHHLKQRPLDKIRFKNQEGNPVHRAFLGHKEEIDRGPLDVPDLCRAAERMGKCGAFFRSRFWLPSARRLCHKGHFPRREPGQRRNPPCLHGRKPTAPIAEFMEHLVRDTKNFPDFILWLIGPCQKEGHETNRDLEFKNGGRCIFHGVILG